MNSHFRFTEITATAEFDVMALAIFQRQYQTNSALALPFVHRSIGLLAA